MGLDLSVSAPTPKPSARAAGLLTLNGSHGFIPFLLSLLTYLEREREP